MKMEFSSQWQDGNVKVHARVKQFSKAVKRLGYENFRSYAGIEAALSEHEALGEWLDSVKDFHVAARIA